MTHPPVPVHCTSGASHSAKREFPNFPPLLLYAISLGRRLQNPLQEFAGLASNSMEDLTALRLHPLQDHVKPIYWLRRTCNMRARG